MSIGFMAAFGLGTLPAMFLLAQFGFLLSITARNYIKQAVPFVIALMGVFLIIRGIGLDIPYLSPMIGKAGAVKCH
jgi:sulfite exporter TauE/SafE